MNKPLQNTLAARKWTSCLLIATIALIALLFSAIFAPTPINAVGESIEITEGAAFSEAPAEEIGATISASEADSEAAAALEPSEDDALTHAQEELATFLCNVIEDALCFDINNLDPAVVALAHYFSGYDGQFVFFGNWENGRSGSFGRLMGVHIIEKSKGNLARFSELLKHEHGHYEQYKQLGLLKYLFAIAIPSLTHDPADYYSQPWEVTADLLGGVTTHRHSTGAEDAGVKYLSDAKNASLTEVIFGSFAKQ